MTGRAVQHSAKSVEHYGPPGIGDLVRQAFRGPIDCDPASSYQANLLIGAENWYGPDWADAGYPQWADGLACPWFGNVYNNPPGGETIFQGKTVNSAALWWATLAHRFGLGLITQAVFMVFNLELFRYAQRYKVAHPTDFVTCFPKDRLDFWKPGPEGKPVPQGAPGHPNAIVYLGPPWGEDCFRTAFESLGKVTR